MAATPPRAIIVSVFGCLATVAAQHYCLQPYCNSKHGVIGKYTSAASEATKCYEWVFKYLNNVVPESNNHGSGYRNTTSIMGEPIKESYDTSSTDLFAMENNECGLSMGKPINETRPMTSEERALVAKKQRLPTGELHQCPCAVEGRAHIINATSSYGVVEKLGVHQTGAPPISEAEMKFYEKGGLNGIFGLHHVKCAFHSSGPCLLDEVERGVAKSWQNNFSMGYLPIMNNNLMLWTPTLGPIIDLFLRDGVHFYPMRWNAPTENGEREVFSVLASPCGKVLIEVAAPEVGGRPKAHFHKMAMSRAVFKQWNQPVGQPLVPLRMSRAVTPAQMEKMLQFYGVVDAKDTNGLRFHTEVLLDDVSSDGTRAVTLRISSSATVHLQLWATREPWEPEPWIPNPVGGFQQDFRDSKMVNQVTGKALQRAKEFCTNGNWSVQRYTWYVLQTHEATLAAIPKNSSTMTPPAGNAMNVFLDDHFSWDCTAAECEVAAGSRAFYDAGSRITFYGYEDPAVQKTYWWPYSHDPAGYGVELHWYNVVPDFKPEGTVPPICFSSRADGTCPGSSPDPTELLV